MPKNLEQILGAKNLCGLIQGKPGGVPEDILPPGFLPQPGNIKPVEGNQGTYTRVEGTRQTARLAHYGSPARKRELTGIAEIPVALVHTFEEIQVKPADVMNLLAEDNPAKQNMGAQTVARQVADFKQLFTNLRVSSLYSALFKGYIYFDGEGNLLGTSSGAKITIDFQIAAAHRDQLGGIIGASWATDSTDILDDLKAIKKQARRDYGAPLKYAFYGANIPKYFAANTAIKALIAGTPSFAEQVARNEMPDIGGFKWVPVYDAFFTNHAGSDTDWAADDLVVFAPEPGPEWLEWLEGTYPIPQSLTLSGDAAQALASLQPAQGMFSYAAVSINPPGVTQYFGDTFLPVIKVPNAIFIADVTP